jgi:hypothetical protein
MEKTKLEQEHLKALKEVIFPMDKVPKNAEGLLTMGLVKEALSIIKAYVMKPDCEIAAEQQKLIKTVIPNLWVHPETKETKTWSSIGFKKVGYMTEENYIYLTKGEVVYCNCPYPIKSEVETHWPCCRKCKKQIL